MFISFLFLSEERRKKRNQRKKKETGATTPLKCSFLCIGNFQQCHCEHFYKNTRPSLVFSGCWVQDDAYAYISTKMLIHIRIFVMFFRFSLDSMLCDCGSILGSFLFLKPRAESCERVFCVPFRATTVFLSSFWSVFLLSFSKEGRKMRKKMFKIYAKYPS